MTRFAAIEGAHSRTPSTWEVVPLKRLAALREDPDIGRSASLLSLKNTGVLVARGDDVQPPSEEHRLRYWLTDEGDLVVNPMWLAGGAIGVSTVSGAVSPDYRVYSLSARVEPRFIHHLFRSAPYHDQYRLLMRAETTFDRRVTKEDFGQLPVLLPPLDEQCRIAALLDAETARIDALIETKWRMVGLLNERFTRHVTATFDAATRRVPLRHFARWREGPGILAVDFRDTGTPLIRLVNLVEDTIKLDGCGYLDPDDVAARWWHLRVREGELLISGSAASGLPVLVPPEADGAVPYTGLIRMWPTSDALNKEFLRLFLGSGVFLDQVDQLKTGVGIQHWGPSHLSQVSIPLPERAAQDEIAGRLLAERVLVRETVSKVQRQIDLLREHRQALITAAVTGQPDVAKAAA